MTQRARIVPFLICAGAAFLAASAPAQETERSALSLIRPGGWELTSRDTGFRSRRLCLGDPRVLLQVRHARATCSRYVISSDLREIVVHYSCPGAGHGRTTVRVETPQLIQIESQGIADNTPFDWSLEGRRLGDCHGVASADAR